MEETSVAACAFGISEDKSQVLTDNKESDSSITVDSISAQHPRPENSESSATERLTSHAETLELSKEMEVLLLSRPQVRLAYCSLLYAIERESDQDIHHLLRKTVGLDLVSRVPLQVISRS